MIKKLFFYSLALLLSGILMGAGAGLGVIPMIILGGIILFMGVVYIMPTEKQNQEGS